MDCDVECYQLVRIWSCPGDGPLNRPVGVLIALTEVCVLRGAAHFGWHNSPAGTRTVWMEKRVLSSNSIHPSLFPDCGCQCEQLLQALAVSTSSSWWAVPLIGGRIHPSSLRLFCQSVLRKWRWGLLQSQYMPFSLWLPWLASWHSSLWNFMKDLTDHCEFQSLHSVKPLPGQASPDWDSECGVRRLPLECGNGMLLVMEVLLGVWVAKLLGHGSPLSLCF